MAEVYRGFTLNVKGDPAWGDRENAFHKAIIDKLLDEYLLLSQKAAANGVATLDGFIKIPLNQLPDSILGSVSYKGVWNATTNTPTLGNSGAGGVKGDYYVVSVAGTTSIDGINDWEMGDWILNNTNRWDKIDNTDADIIVSVNSKTGVVVINPDDLDDALTTHKFVSQGQIDAFHTHSNKAQLDLVTDGDHDVRTDNPHGVTKTQVGLSNVPNLDTTSAVADDHTHSNKAQLDLVTDGDHDVRTDNPHGVTKTQVGLSNVPNLDTTTAVNSAHAHSNKAQLDLVTDGDHDVRTDNPHGVTKTQVGLSNVPNLDTTSAVNDDHTHSNKAQLDLVTDGDHDVRTDNPHSVTKTQVGLSNVPNLDTTTAVNNTHTHNTKRITFANTPYTVLITDRKLIINTDGGNVVANLPAGSTHEDHRIVNVGTSNKIVTLNPNGLEKLLGANTGFVLYDGESLDIAFDSTEGWY